MAELERNQEYTLPVSEEGTVIGESGERKGRWVMGKESGKDKKLTVGEEVGPFARTRGVQTRTINSRIWRQTSASRNATRHAVLRYRGGWWSDGGSRRTRG